LLRLLGVLGDKEKQMVEEYKMDVAELIPLIVVGLSVDGDDVKLELSAIDSLFEDEGISAACEVLHEAVRRHVEEKGEV
jgi:hypothetical protein